MNTNDHRHGIHIGIIPDKSRRWAEKKQNKELLRQAARKRY